MFLTGWDRGLRSICATGVWTRVLLTLSSSATSTTTTTETAGIFRKVVLRFIVGAGSLSLLHHSLKGKSASYWAFDAELFRTVESSGGIMHKLLDSEAAAP